MAEPWRIDVGDGGGQLVRTAMAVAALAGRPCELRNIRAGRPKPGLAAQHLAAVQAVAQAAGGTLAGDELGSRELHFEPGDATGPVWLETRIGTAGSTMLVLQATMPLLVRRGGGITVSGGTDNPLAPPVDYTTQVLLPALGAMGIEFGLELARRGFYPAGGGLIRAECAAHPTWRGFERLEWDGPVRIAGVAYSARLPLHVVERMRDTAVKRLRKGDGLTADQRARLREGGIKIELRPDEDAASPGAGLVLWAEDAAGRRLGAGALGERSKPAERVGDEAAGLLLDELAAGAPCDRHLCDQLAVWAALADGPCAWRVSRVTDHLTTVLRLLEDGLGVRFSLDGTTVRKG